MSKVSPEASTKARPRVVDLEITIRVQETSGLLFEVNASDPTAGINGLEFSPVRLATPPKEFLHHLFKDIESFPLDTEKDRKIAERKLAVKGLAIWRLFPRELRELLWKRRRMAQTLLIQSDEPYIPWEIAKLQKRDRNGLTVTGPFLSEAFAVTRWLRGHSHQTHLPLRNLALIVPRTSRLKGAAAEQKEIRTLAEHHGRKVTDIEPTYPAVHQALSTGLYGGFHFAGHGAVVGDDANRWHIELDEPPHFRPEDLFDEAQNLGTAHPLVFLNGCTTGRGGLTLTGPGGWSSGFLEAKAGGFIGTYWEVADGKSREFATSVYRSLFQGSAIGEAVRQARLRLHRKHTGDPTWLAYTVFAHPLASCAGLSGPTAQRELAAERTPTLIKIPFLPWRKDRDSPGALLRAQYGVVPFHRREKELDDLQAWCRDASPVKVRLYTGPGGMGKTRLALEAARLMKDEGWRAGFATNEALKSPEKTWKELARPDGKLLLIVDYAETNRPFLIPILREMVRLERGPIRLILLARAALDWWEQLKSERDGVGELLSGPATARFSLQPLVDTAEARASSYALAAKAFSERLQTPPSEAPDDLVAEHYQRVLVLHMKALVDMEGEENAKGEDHILDRILDRERKFWETRTADHGISREIATGIGRAMAAITLGGGVQGESETIEVLRGLQFFNDQPAAVLIAVGKLLHECYPGERWIEPLQPDLLGEHLVQRELEQGADELFDLVLGPRSGE